MGIAEHDTEQDDAGTEATGTFTRVAPGYGSFVLRRLQPDEDAAVVHDWVTRPHARYWGMQDESEDGVRAAYQAIVDSRHTNAYLGLFESEPTFVIETYDPAAEPVGEHYDVQPGDRGMHILVAPPRRRIPGFTWQVFRVAMEFLFSDPAVTRVVVEPDVRNDGIHRLNRRAGFEHVREIVLPEKKAWLGFCTRDRYRAAAGWLEEYVDDG